MQVPILCRQLEVALGQSTTSLLLFLFACIYMMHKMGVRTGIM